MSQNIFLPLTKKVQYLFFVLGFIFIFFFLDLKEKRKSLSHLKT